MAWHGVCLTLKASEFPNDAAVCSLSDVVEVSKVPQKYYLTPQACAGILKRSRKRNKKLPAPLEEALEAVAGPLMSSE